MGKRLIYDTRDLETCSEDILNRVDRALVAAAFTIRDEMRNQFLMGSGQYKYSTKDYDDLAKGIMVGKLRNGEVKIHALGSKEDYDTYKTRFFVGGTVYRQGTSKNGKPYSKGYIKSNDAVDKGLSNAQNTINTYINNTLNN